MCVLYISKILSLLIVYMKHICHFLKQLFVLLESSVHATDDAETKEKNVTVHIMNLFLQNMDMCCPLRKSKGRKRFSLDIFEVCFWKLPIEMVYVCRIYLQMFHFWEKMNEAFVSFSKHTSYHQQESGLQSAHLILLCIILHYNVYYFHFTLQELC